MSPASVRRALVVVACVVSLDALAQGAGAPVPPVEDVYDEATSHPAFEHFAPRIFTAPPRASLHPDDVRAGAEGALQGGGTAAWPLLYRDRGLTVNGSLAATAGAFAFRNNAFATPASQATSSYPVDPRWAELFVEPGVTAQWRFSGAMSIYGGAAYMETATRGVDYAGVGNRWHGDREQLYAGVRWEDKARNLGLDVSYGQQNLALGQSFLVAAGATNDAERGATYLGPRTAWANAAIAKATLRDLEAQAFWLKPNEELSESTGTRIAGIEVAWQHDGPLRGALLYMHVPRSSIATRDGLDVYDVRARWHPSAQLPNAWLAGEYAWQRKSGVAASGWYAAANYNAKDAPWNPLVMVRYARLSGDDPATSRWEGFDSLYFGGGTPDWYQGKLGTNIFDNTNLASVAASVTLAPNERNLLQVIALAFRAVEVDAPLEIPAPNVPVATGGGVPRHALASEVDVVWTYTFDHRINVNVFGAYAWPGAGYKDLYASQGGSARRWTGFGVQLNVNY